MFQSLIGTIKTFLILSAQKCPLSVSIPYRDDKNVDKSREKMWSKS